MHRWIKSLCLSLALGLMLPGPAPAAELVVVMDTGAAPITKDQLADIYLGRSSSLKPLDLPESSELREQFYKKVTHRDAAQVKALWSRIIFTGQGQPPKELPGRRGREEGLWPLTQEWSAILISPTPTRASRSCCHCTDAAALALLRSTDMLVRKAANVGSAASRFSTAPM
jgi:hypothetical protein